MALRCQTLLSSARGCASEESHADEANAEQREGGGLGNVRRQRREICGDRVSKWGKTLQPSNPFMHINFGNALRESGRNADALIRSVCLDLIQSAIEGRCRRLENSGTITILRHFGPTKATDDGKLPLRVRQ
jgi:hypothetical protein